MAFSQQQQLFLIISRHNLNPSMIPPFKIIIPMLQLMCPIRLFTSMEKQITLTNSLGSTFSSLYESLVYHLQNQEGDVNLSNTLNIIYNQKLQQQRKQNTLSQHQTLTSQWKFRICILGQEIVTWDIVMKYKLKNIIIDTIGQNKRLQQISFATGGINKSPLLNQNITKLFMTIFSLSTECRKKFNFLSLAKDGEVSNYQTIQFTVDCICCGNESKQLNNECFLCSKCLAIHCSSIYQTCKQCGSMLEAMDIHSKPC